jgi:hypothetical protein
MESFPTLESLGFPARRSNHCATWVPIYLEPMVGSGERLCIGIVAADTNQAIVLGTQGLERLACVYGEEAEAFVFASHIALRSTQTKVNKDGIRSLAGWRGGMEGLVFGAVRAGAGESLEDVAQTGLMQSASLLQTNQIDLSETGELIARAEPTSRRLETLIRDSVTAQRKDLYAAFGKLYQTSENTRPTRIGFVGRRLAANFSLLVPGRIAPLVDLAKAKLWDLSQLKSGAMADMFPQAEGMEFELLLHRVSPQDPQYNKRQITQVMAAVRTLEEEADKASIRCRPMYSTSEIAEFLLLREAA